MERHAVREGVLGVYGVFQPGDATRYEFSLVNTKPDWVFIGGTLAYGYEYQIEQLQTTAKQIRSVPDGESLKLYYVQYVAEKVSRSQSPAGPALWTARALILWADEVLRGDTDG